MISGGARGIGRALALALAAQGWSAAICYRTSQQEAHDTIDRVLSHGVRGLAEQCDVSDPVAAATLAENVERRWKRIDALINCAGPYHRVNLLQETVEGWLEMFATNLHPVFYLSRAVTPGMKARGW